MYVPAWISAARNVVKLQDVRYKTRDVKLNFMSLVFYDIMSVMKRSIWFWVCFVVAIFMAIYFATRIIMVGMGRGKLAQVHNISIVTDSRDADMDAMRAAAGGLVRNSYNVDLDALNARIGAVPGVKKSAVRRLPNGNLAVRADMHRAVAQWSDGASYFPLSADGTVVNSPSDVRDLGAVVFIGTLPDDISDITAAARNMVADVAYLEWIENRRWNLVTMGGITVMLPENNPVQAISTLISLNQNHGILGKKIQVIDMRDDARILVK